MTKIAINGTGRIGLIAARIASNRDDVELVAMNTTADVKMLAYLLKYDSVHNFNLDVEIVSDDCIKLNGKEVKLLSDRDPKNLNFVDFGAEVVLECTGKFLTMEKAQAFIDRGVKKVVMSAPAKDDTPTFVMNINTDNYNGENIISNASCTTNALAPMVKVLDDTFGVENGLMTTIHSYTNDQNTLDGKHPKDMRRARAAAMNMLPTTTGAAKAIAKVMPHLKGKLNGYAMRVPTADVSVVDLNVNLKKSATAEDINSALKLASEGEFRGLIEIDEEKRVSSDFLTSSYSTTIAMDMTSVIDGNLAKVLSWYDNEWGYTTRLIDMVVFISK